MDIVKQFAALVAPEREELAKITGDRGGGTYSAETASGTPLILYGSAEVGQHVYYDAYTSRITAQAPVVQFIDIPV